MAVLIKLLTLCSISFFKFYLFLYGCSGSSMLHGLLSSGGEQGSSPVAVCERLIALAFLVVECGLWGEESSLSSGSHGLSSCGSWALGRRRRSCGELSCSAPCGIFLAALQHVGSGTKPMSPALIGGFFTTEPPGKPCSISYMFANIHECGLTEITFLKKVLKFV